MAFAIYELDPIGKDGALEANGSIHWYCSEGCHSAGRTDFKVDIAEGLDADWPDGTICEWCTTPLETRLDNEGFTMTTSELPEGYRYT